MDIDADDGACAGAADSGERHRPRTHSAEPPAEPGPVCPAMRADAAAPRHQPGGDRRGDALYSGGAGDDWPDGRARWWATPRLGTTATAIAGRIGAISLYRQRKG